MKDFVRTHWKKAAAAILTTGATGAAYYYGGPLAAAKVQELLPTVLQVLGQ